MSSAKLDLVRSIYAAWERGDFGSAEWADPEVEYEYADGPSPGAWKGIEGMVEGFRDFLGAWEDWCVVADDYLELDGGRVLVSFHFSGRGKASGVDMAKLHTNGATLFLKSATARSRRSSNTSTATVRSPTSASHRTPAPDSAVSCESRCFLRSHLARFVAQTRQFLFAEAFIDLEHLARSVEISLLDEHITCSRSAEPYPPARRS